MEFYLAQISGVLAWILLFISYWKNGNNKLLYLQVASCLFFALNYFFLGAFSGLLVVIFEMIRDYLYTKVKNPNKAFLISSPFYIIISLFSFEGIISLFSVFASTLDAYALTKKNKKVVVLGIFTYILWLIYDIKYASYGTIIAETILIISNSIVLIKYNNAYFKSNKLLFARGLIINSKIIDTFASIDASNFDDNYNWSKSKINKIMKNKKVEYVYIHDEENIIGYIQFINISNKKYNEILNNKEYTDIKTTEIEKFKSKKDNIINIYTISIQLHYQNKKTIELTSNFIKEYLYRKNKAGYYIKNVIANGVSEFEQEVFNNLGFKKHDEEKNRHYVYTLSNEKLNEYLNK